jgi:hypothetical protein
MNVGYDFYFTLAECFGWELYGKAFGRLMRWLQKTGSDPALDAIPEKGPTVKRDRFFTVFCEESGYNLLPYFQKYGLAKGDFALSQEVVSRVNKLPVWSGNRPMEGVGGPTEITIPVNAQPGSQIARFTGHDPDPGTIFTYKITDGNTDEAFAIDPRSGVLTLQKKPGLTTRTLLIESQDNCIPLSTSQTRCRVSSARN